MNDKEKIEKFDEIIKLIEKRDADRDVNVRLQFLLMNEIKEILTKNWTQDCRDTYGNWQWKEFKELLEK